VRRAKYFIKGELADEARAWFADFEIEKCEGERKLLTQHHARMSDGQSVRGRLAWRLEVVEQAQFANPS
jgi:hypothetical protein